MDIYEGAQRIEADERLDAPAGFLAEVGAKLAPAGPLKDALSGTWLGHALHPALTDVPIGAWVSTAVLDLFGGTESETASRRLIGFGILSAVPTALSGLSDYSDTHGAERRVGVVHAASNSLALMLYGASYLARRAGRTGMGKALAFLGMSSAMSSAYLGGHLSLSLGVGVDHTVFEAGPSDWTDVLNESELQDGIPRKVEAEGAEVMVVRHGGRLCALDNRCSHLGGPLSEGKVEAGAVTCPWHGSTFSLDDGKVTRGPARSPQPVFETRVTEGRVEIRRKSGAES
jgi:nitrite reductase/ring-hydroxylating ferredoxin subunit/uncharacterized membrane protein